MKSLINISVMAGLLPWILPPLLGALIGYVTNALAIRMLFRPLREYRFLGIRLPFTPGVIPRRRDELAESIGRMVERDLLTTDVFARRFGSEQFRRVLRRGVYDLITVVSNTDIQKARSYIDPVWLLDLLGDYLCGMVKSDELLLRRISEEIADGVVFRADSLGKSAAHFLLNLQPLQEIDRRQVDALVRGAWPSVRDTLESVLHEDDTQRQLQDIVRRVLAYTLDQLNSLQRLVVVAGQYDRQLLGRVPSIVSRTTAEISAYLNRDQTTETIIDRVSEWASIHRGERIGALLSGKATEGLEEVIVQVFTDRTSVQKAIEGSLDLLRREDTCERGVTLVRKRIERFFESRRDMALGEMIPMVRRGRGYVARWTADKMIPLLSELTPPFVAQLNIYQVVVDRINDLEIERVEDLLLGIIRRHLRWINAFGALLGAGIGGVQLVLRVIGL